MLASERKKRGNPFGVVEKEEQGKKFLFPEKFEERGGL